MAAFWCRWLESASGFPATRADSNFRPWRGRRVPLVSFFPVVLASAAVMSYPADDYESEVTWSQTGLAAGSGLSGCPGTWRYLGLPGSPRGWPPSPAASLRGPSAAAPAPGPSFLSLLAHFPCRIRWFSDPRPGRRRLRATEVLTELLVWAPSAPNSVTPTASDSLHPQPVYFPVSRRHVDSWTVGTVSCLICLCTFSPFGHIDTRASIWIHQ